MRVLQVAGSPSAEHCTSILAAGGADVLTVTHDKLAEALRGSRGLDAIIRPAWFDPPRVGLVEFVGHSAEPPRRGSGGPGSDHAPWRSFVHGAVLAVEALAWRLGSSTAGLRQLSRQLAAGAILPRPGRGRTTGRRSDGRLMKTADGWIVVGSSLLDRDLAVRLVSGESSSAPWHPGDAIGEWLRGQTSMEAAGQLQRVRTQATPILDPTEAAAFHEVECPTPALKTLPSPAAPEPRPLVGTRVLDLTHLWAGPLCTQILRILGSDVIKVEGPRHPDRLRLWDEDDRMVPSFAALNDGKRGLAIDLSRAEGRAAFKEVLANVDGVVDNYSPRALANWGLSPDRLSQDYGLTWISIPAFSAAGSFGTWAARGAGIEGTSGLAHLHGDSLGPLLMDQPMTDVMAGLYAACAYLRLGGQGSRQHVEISQNGVARTFATSLSEHSSAIPPGTASLSRPIAARPPGVGEHSRELLYEIGLPAARIDQLVECGTVA